jgi:hypothetical protein
MKLIPVHFLLALSVLGLVRPSQAFSFIAPERKTELHWSICEGSSAGILDKLDLKVKEEETRQTSYFDDASLSNFKAGTILRLRQSPEDGRISTVKIDFDSYPRVEDDWYDVKGFKCEEDSYGLRQSYSCSLDNDSDEMQGARKPANLFSADQRELIDEYATQPIDWDRLEKHGPVKNRVWKLKDLGDLPVVLESMRLPDGTEFFELSSRVPRSRAASAYRRLSREWEKRDLKLCAAQESKTKKVLQFFHHESRELSL